MRAALVFCAKNSIPALQVPLALERATLGSDPACDFVVTEPGVKSKHLEIEHLGGQFRLRSRHPDADTRINGVRVQEHWLRNGDTIQLGPNLQVKFREETLSNEPLVCTRSRAGPAAPDQAFQYLRSHSLFHTMSDDSLERIAQSSRLLRVPAGEPVVRQGERGHSFYLIASGLLDVVKNGAVVSTLGQNSFFGEVALLKGGVRAATVIATAPSELYELDRPSFDLLTKSNPALVKHFIRLLASYGEEAMEPLGSVEERIEKHLASLLSAWPGIPMPSLRLIQAPVFHGPRTRESAWRSPREAPAAWLNWARLRRWSARASPST